MNDLRTAAQQALEVLEFCTPKPRPTDDDYAEQGWKEHNAAITALRSALAQRDEPVEPVATLTAQRDALLEALRALVRNEGLDAYSYLDKGIGTATAAGQRWLNARAAIKAVEETK